MKRAAVVVAVVALLALVFWLKLQHAVDVCLDAGGRWSGGECAFEEPDGSLSTDPGRR